MRFDPEHDFRNGSPTRVDQGFDAGFNWRGSTVQFQRPASLAYLFPDGNLTPYASIASNGGGNGIVEVDIRILDSILIRGVACYISIYLKKKLIINIHIICFTLSYLLTYSPYLLLFLVRLSWPWLRPPAAPTVKPETVKLSITKCCSSVLNSPISPGSHLKCLDSTCTGLPSGFNAQRLYLTSLYTPTYRHLSVASRHFESQLPVVIWARYNVLHWLVSTFNDKLDCRLGISLCKLRLH